MTQLASNDLDNMFIKGLAGLTTMSLALGTMSGAASMLPTNLAPAMRTFMGFEMANTALNFTQSLYEQRPQNNGPKPNGPTGMG